MEPWASEYMTLIEDCETREERLTDWERGFVDDMRRRLEAGDRLTLGQSEKLDQVWENATRKG